MSFNVEADVKGAITTFKWHEAHLRLLLAGPEGPVVRDLVRRAVRVEALAKQIASEPSPSAPGRGPGVVTGRLRGSITWRLGVDPISAYVDVGTAVYYAPFLEKGTSNMAARPFLRPALEAARV